MLLSHVQSHSLNVIGMAFETRHLSLEWSKTNFTPPLTYKQNQLATRNVGDVETGLGVAASELCQKFVQVQIRNHLRSTQLYAPRGLALDVSEIPLECLHILEDAFGKLQHSLPRRRWAWRRRPNEQSRADPTFHPRNRLAYGGLGLQQTFRGAVKTARVHDSRKHLELLYFQLFLTNETEASADDQMRKRPISTAYHMIIFIKSTNRNRRLKSTFECLHPSLQER